MPDPSLKLIHKRIASGTLFDEESEIHPSASNYPGWTGSPMYTSHAPSGTDLKYCLFHNYSDYDQCQIQIYLHNTGEENEVVNVEIYPKATIEWDLSYLIHLESGDSVYAKAGSGSTGGQPPFGLTDVVNYHPYGAENWTGIWPI